MLRHRNWLVGVMSIVVVILVLIVLGIYAVDAPTAGLVLGAAVGTLLVRALFERFDIRITDFAFRSGIVLFTLASLTVLDLVNPFVLIGAGIGVWVVPALLRKGNIVIGRTALIIGLILLIGAGFVFATNWWDAEVIGWVLVGVASYVWLVPAVLVRVGLAGRQALTGTVIGFAVLGSIGMVIWLIFFTSAGPLTGASGKGKNGGSENGGGSGQGQVSIECHEVMIEDIRVVMSERDLKAGLVAVETQLTGYPVEVSADKSACVRVSGSPDIMMTLEGKDQVAVKRGGWLREVAFDLDSIITDDAIEEQGYDSYRIDRDADALIELKDWPRGSFFEARSVSDVMVSQYLNTETTSWSQSHFEDVQFSYLPPATRFVRPLLAVSFQVGSVGEGVAAAGGVLGSLTISWAYESVIGERLKTGVKGVRDWWKARRRKRE